MVCECNSVIEASVQHIHTCIEYHNYQEAIFTAERIFAENPSDEIIYLLAKSYYLDKQPKKAKLFLLQQDSKYYKCKYLLAKCFMDIGCTTEAENTLLGVGQDNTTPSDIAIFYKDAAPSVLLLLADIYKIPERRKFAIACLKKCSELNPFFWSPFKDLIDLRENVDPQEIFSLSSGLILNNSSCLRALSNKINIGAISHPNCPSKKRTDIHDSQEDLSVSRENVNPQYENLYDTINENDVINLTQENFQYSFNNTPVRVEMDSSNNSDRGSSNLSNDCGSNIEETGHSRQILCKPKPMRIDEIEKTKPMFGNICSIPLHSMHACVPAFNLKAHETPENLQTHFASHNSLILSQNNSRKVRNNHKKNSYTAFRPAASTPLVQYRSEKMTVFNNPSTPITKNSDQNNSIDFMSPLVFESASATDQSKSVDLSQPVESKMLPLGHIDHVSCGPRTRSQAAKAAAAQKSGYSKKLSHSRDDQLHAKSICEPDVRFQSASSKPLFESDNRLESAINYLKLLATMGKCYRALRFYKCNDVISYIKLLPKHQAETSLVYSWLATAFIEMNNRQKALELLSLSHKYEPWQLYGMVIYSVELWKSKNEAQLLSLANEISEMDRETPEYWCILGNAMSLNKENEVALRFIQRAVQVCPTYSYGYILLGHEYFEQEELVKAIDSFRKALDFDSNEYHSHSGMAMVYQRQENYVKADEALKDALKINPDSSYLLTHLAGIRMKLNQFYSPEGLLDLLEKACQSCPKDPFSRYQKATLLYKLGRHHESLADLKILESIINKEARIYILMSNNYKKLGEMSKAMMYRSWATERDPKCSTDPYSLDHSFTTPVPMGVQEPHLTTNSTIMSNRNTSFTISGRRNSESMQEDPLDNHHSSDFLTSD